MIRRTLTILSLIGLLLSLGLWGVSYWDFQYVDGTFNIVLKSGRLGVLRGRTLQQHIDAAIEIRAFEDEHGIFVMQDGYLEKLQESLADNRKWTFLGFTDWHTTWWSPVPMVGRTYLLLPMWLPAMLCTAIIGLNCGPPLVRRRKRKKLGLCVKCGYDLRASKERCPECGEAFEK